MFKFLFYQHSFVWAQHIGPKFEKLKRSDITAADFESTVYSIDTSAEAVVLLDQGTINFISNKANWFNKCIQTFRKNQGVKTAGRYRGNA